MECGGSFTLSFEGLPLFRLQSMLPSVMSKPPLCHPGWRM